MSTRKGLLSQPFSGNTLFASPSSPGNDFRSRPKVRRASHNNVISRKGKTLSQTPNKDALSLAMGLDPSISETDAWSHGSSIELEVADVIDGEDAFREILDLKAHEPLTLADQELSKTMLTGHLIAVEDKTPGIREWVEATQERIGSNRAVKTRKCLHRWT